MTIGIISKIIKEKKSHTFFKFLILIFLMITYMEIIPFNKNNPPKEFDIIYNFFDIILEV